MRNFDRNMRRWAGVLRVLRTQSPGEVIRLPKHLLPHPEDSGASRSIGLPFGQSADYRWRLGDCSGLHVRDFGLHYEAHIDRVDPTCDPIEHLRQDAPEAYVAGMTAIGSLIGLALGGSKEATFAGAGLGALMGALTLPENGPKSTGILDSILNCS